MLGTLTIKINISGFFVFSKLRAFLKNFVRGGRIRLLNFHISDDCGDVREKGEIDLKIFHSFTGESWLDFEFYTRI